MIKAIKIILAMIENTPELLGDYDMKLPRSKDELLPMCKKFSGKLFII